LDYAVAESIGGLIVISDLDCARLCAQIYQPDAAKLFDVFDAGEDDGVCWGIKRTDTEDVIVFRGSKTIPDWIKDLIALATPFSHHVFGPVHPGFLLGMDKALSDIQPLLRSLPRVCSGHSLGAGRGTLCTALLKTVGLQVARRVNFGEPKPGFSRLADFIADTPAASYRTGNVDGNLASHDLVTDVPFSFPPEEYIHPNPLIHLEAKPLTNDWGPFSYHHIGLYVTAMEAGELK
jgi:hypothetical protein